MTTNNLNPENEATEAYAEMEKHARKLEIEIEMLRHREETCETMDRAENFALFRAIQEIGRVVGLTDENSPSEIVERVKLMSEKRFVKLSMRR
tara:strand:- start:284 stop:562 length:279 start_codon:yes stop_codon:yes gene_type:complete